MKKFILTVTLATSVLFTGIGTSLQAFASETNASPVIHAKTDIPTNVQLEQQLQNGKGDINQKGVKSYLTKLAAQLLASAIRHGGDLLGKLLKELDDDVAKAFSKNSRSIANYIDEIAEIPDVTTRIIKEKLYYFLVGTLGMNGGYAQQIANTVKWIIDNLVL
ncbi:hypothetical protein J2Z48_000863 [Croceifilum oryzae]|uniref:DUF4197 domain-containing protein n=1 Tax=Croceifilum oryzae TaxID=1553429 RepID=A0AAJ1WT68_9BACL|nr:hypothetical protein [Croceifilum oryzae]MDQ0416696.1 hypothetical protein [Croceifilum oryzae]